VQGIETAGMYLIGVHLAGAHLTGVHLRGHRTFIPIEEATRPTGVLCGMGWGDQVPLNGSGQSLSWSCGSRPYGLRATRCLVDLLHRARYRNHNGGPEPMDERDSVGGK
jgi:hypothetical protein